MTHQVSGALRVTVVGDAKWRARIKRADKDIQTGVEQAIEFGLLLLEGDIKHRVSGTQDSEAADKARARGKSLPIRGAGGVVLNKRTGDLFRSITSRLRRAGADSSGEVGTPIIYARTHELGLTVKFPNRGFSIDFPERPFVRPSFEKHRETIINDIRRALNKAVS